MSFPFSRGGLLTEPKQLIELPKFHSSRPALSDPANEPVHNGQVASVARAGEQRNDGRELLRRCSELTLQEPCLGEQDCGLGMLPDQPPICPAKDVSTQPDRLLSDTEPKRSTHVIVVQPLPAK